MHFAHVLAGAAVVAGTIAAVVPVDKKALANDTKEPHAPYYPWFV